MSQFSESRRSARLQAGDDQPALGPSSVDQLLRAQAGSGPEIRQMSLGCARPDAYAGRCNWHRAAGGDEGSEHVDLAGRPRQRRFAAKVPTPHASRLLAAAIHSSRPSMGMS
jgi:hypothetical protein